VSRLRRPTPALWAANRLARLEPEPLDTFLDTVETLRGTQLRDPRTAANTLRRHRADLDALARRAGEILTDHGHRATPALRRRIADTLLGAAVDRTLAGALREGRLTSEPPAPGFEILTGAPRAAHLRLVPHPTTAGEQQARTRPPQREVDTPSGRRARQAQREVEARQECEHRQRVAEDLEREAEAHRAAADTTRREIDELVRKTRAARARLREVQRAARAATVAGRKARRAADPRPARTTRRDGLAP
jgi:hypothetical protein